MKCLNGMMIDVRRPYPMGLLSIQTDLVHAQLPPLQLQQLPQQHHLSVQQPNVVRFSLI